MVDCADRTGCGAFNSLLAQIASSLQHTKISSMLAGLDQVDMYVSRTVCVGWSALIRDS